MKLALAQFRPVPGDLMANRQRHLALVEHAVAAGAGAILFPELSLSGYEPRLAHACAMAPSASFFNPFQEWANRTGIVIGAGVPIGIETGVRIGLVFFQPEKPVQVYTKKYLHPDEEPYFIPGTAEADIRVGPERLIPAVCYEISIPRHAEDALAAGPGVYVASAAKTKEGMDAAALRLARIAGEFGVPVAIVNSIGPNDDFVAAGLTTAFTPDGRTAGQLGEEETLLIVDTDTGATAVLLV